MSSRKIRKSADQREVPGATLEVQIERIVPDGFGIGFAEGKTVFVSLAVPGDLVKVQIERQKGTIAFASIVEIIESSAERREAPCPYFGRCGGCDFQQMNYAAQLAAKVGIIKDALRRIGKINWEQELKIIASPHEWNYRTRAQWKREENRLGYFERNSHRVCDVEICPIIAPPLQKTLSEARGNLRRHSFAEIRAVSAGNSVSLRFGGKTDDFDENFYAANKEEAERNHAVEANNAAMQAEIVNLRIADFAYQFSADTFFQVNHDILPQVIETVTGDATGDFALDLYCGAGLFTLPLAKKFREVAGIEGSELSIEFARRNADNAGLTNIRFETALVGEWLKRNSANLPRADFVLLDPPRTGAERETIESLIKMQPRRIVYVSCNPTTLARDLKLLLEDDSFEIEEITAFDFFPQTHHIETVVRLKKI